MHILSPAKVNLRLEVLGRREDGYHEIYSVMQPISLYDGIDLSISRGSGIELSVKGRPLPEGRENLAWKAAEAFFRATGKEAKVMIRLKKIIPVAAGLGGGSSNAATVLLGLNHLFGNPLSQESLLSLGKGLGADVPFFIRSTSAVARGVGDILEPVELPKPWYLLIWPGRHISTGMVYSSLNFDLTKGKVGINMPCSIEEIRDITTLRSLLYNDLERVSARICPEVKVIKEALIRHGAMGSLMSGSGSTVFGIFAEKEAARRAMLGLLREFDGKGWDLYIAKGI